MKFDHKHYVPCLRWKQGEYQAILLLSDNAKASITPLIEIPEIGYDHEDEKPIKTIDEHLEKFAKRVMKKWGLNPCFIAIPHIKPSERLKDGRHPLKFIFDNLRENKCNAIPVTGVIKDKAFGSVIKSITSTDNHGLCIRVNIEDATNPELKRSIDTILGMNSLNADRCDLVLDLGTPNFKPVDGFTRFCVALIKRLPLINRWRSFTICGTSFPKSMGEVKLGATLLKRYEWLLYKSVVDALSTDKIRLPSFGDYVINHPHVPDPPLDMRIIKPAASIRYTSHNSWFIVKGLNNRDNPFQYKELSEIVTSSPHYSGKNFSFGDEYIADCAKSVSKRESLTRWRQVGTNHHIEKVVDDISSFYESLDNL